MLLLVAACTQFNVRADHDPGADLSRLRTYAWLPPEEAAPADQRVPDRYFDRRIREGVAKALAAKGDRPVEPGQTPDFLLNYRFATEPASNVRANPRGYFGGIWWANWMSAGAFYSDNYDDGTLYIAVLEPSSKQIIWLGQASARLVPTMSFERRTKRVDDAVEQIMARFPNG